MPPLLLAFVFAAAAAQKPWTDAPPAAARPTAPPASIAQLVKQSMPGVVGIVALSARGSSDPFHDFLERMYGPSPSSDGDQPVRGVGTGFFIRADGLVVTNGHVVEGATDITVQIGEDERAYRGVLVGKDDATDLALVKVEGGPFSVLALGDSDALEVGEWVVAIGNPFGLSRSVTTGIVSYKGRRDVNPSGKPGYYDFIQTDAAINPGNSGGPLLDSRGAVIGINAAVNPAGQGIGFAIPIGMLKDVLPQLEKGRVVRSWAGVTVQEQMGPELAESFGVPGGKGVVVTDVVAAGPAARAGLRTGDVIVSFEGEPIAESYRLRWLTGNAGPRRTVRIGIWREGRLQDVRLTLAEKPGTAPEPAVPSTPRAIAEPFGLSVDDPEQKGSGVRVAAVDIRGDAYRAGIREGDLLLEVDGRPVRDQAEFRRALAGSTSRVARLFVRRGNRAIFFALRRSGPAAAPRLDSAQLAAPR